MTSIHRNSPSRDTKQSRSTVALSPILEDERDVAIASAQLDPASNAGQRGVLPTLYLARAMEGGWSGGGSTISRQRIAQQLQRAHGNHFVQRLIQRDNGEDEEAAETISEEQPSAELAVPSADAPSLGSGQLTLDPGIFQQQPIAAAVPVGELMQPSPELLNSLVTNWQQDFQRRYTGPAIPQDAWTQIWQQWRRLADRWIARGDPIIANPSEAQDLLREDATEFILQQLSGQEPSEPPSAGDVASDVAEQVWPAFQAAIEATQFYQQITSRAGELAEEHWPVLIPLVGTALASAIATGAGYEDWSQMETLAGALTSIPEVDIPIGEDMHLLLSFAESEAAPGEEGVVIGLRPRVGLRWDFEGGRNLQVQGDADMRFQTGAESESGFQFGIAGGLEVSGQF